MAVKFYMKKTYDKLEWKFIRVILTRLGFHPRLIDCVTPQKYYRIFVIILLYIPGINRIKLGFFQEFVKCYMVV